MSTASVKPVVVFIDDEPMNLVVFEAAMPDVWDVHVYEKPEQALSDIKSQKVQPWCVISDQRMPVMRGVNVLEKIKALCPLSVRIIVTGYSEEDLVIESVRRAQIFDYIKKPWDPEDLVASVERAIRFYESEMQRKSLLEELQKTYSEIDRLAQFPKQIPAVMISISQSGQLNYINPFGRFFLSLVGLDEKAYVRLLPLTVTDIISSCLDRQEEISNLEARIGDRFILWTISSDQNKTNVYCTAVDITEKKHAEELEISVMAAQEADKQKTKFIANMSHELRTPLNAIIGYSEMMMEDLKEGGELHFEQWIMDLGRIVDSGKHLLNLVNDILDINKIEAGALDVKLVEVDVVEVVHDVAQMLQPTAKESNNQLSLHSLGDPMVMADPIRLKQILVNLLSNACKFTKDGRIEVASYEKNGQVYLEVRDTGIGIPAEDMEKLFKRFSQIGDASVREGTGLGLEISRQLADRMQGTITARSDFGKGSTFTLVLPCAAQAIKAMP